MSVRGEVLGCGVVEKVHMGFMGVCGVGRGYPLQEQESSGSATTGKQRCCAYKPWCRRRKRAKRSSSGRPRRAGPWSRATA